MYAISDDSRPKHDPRLGWARPATPVLRRRRDGILPTLAAALSQPGAGTLTATAHRSGPAPQPHPLVRAVLESLGSDRSERHAGRCPETVLISRRITEAGARTVQEARAALRRARITTRHIREEGDPRHGAYARHCHVCTTLLAHFGLRSVAPSSEATTALRLPTGGARGTAGGGAAAPAAPAGAGRWPERPDRAAVEAERWSRELAAHRSPLGHRHTVTPAARAAWAEYGGLRLLPTGPGAVHVPVPVVLDPMLGRHWPRTLGDLGRALGTVLSPLGATGLPADGAGAGARAGDGDGDEAGCDGALLAVDREGRVYCLDHSGDWFLGPDVRSALTVLLTGARPHRLGPPPGPPGDARDGAAGGPAEAR